jgi:hypothetical protein
MPALAKTDRAKLAKVLALLGSDREGEALPRRARQRVSSNCAASVGGTWSSLRRSRRRSRNSAHGARPSRGVWSGPDRCGRGRLDFSATFPHSDDCQRNNDIA